MGWKQSELDRIARVQAETREAERKARTAAPATQPDRSRGLNVHKTAVPGKTPDRSKSRNTAEPGVTPDRHKAHEKREFVVTSKKCAHGKNGDVVELEATGAVFALVEAGVLRPHVKAAIKAETKEASDG